MRWEQLYAPVLRSVVEFLLTRLLCVYFVKYILFIYLRFIQIWHYCLLFIYSAPKKFSYFVIEIVDATRCGANFLKIFLVLPASCTLFYI